MALPFARMAILATLAVLGAIKPQPGTALLLSRRPFLVTKASSRLRAAAAMASLGNGGGEPRLLLTSSGLTTPALESSFRRMLSRVTAEGTRPKIAMLVTAQMCGSGEKSTSTNPKRRSPGELRRRRWADARKKGKEIEQALGIEVECIDCAREDQPAELYREPLSSAECIWVLGGNTFFLWHWMRRSGVDEIIKQRVLEDGVVYVGQSAGSIVAGSTIRTAYWKGWDDPSAAPDADWTDEAQLKAMGLAPDGIAFFPHYTDEWAAVVEEKKGEVERIVCLTDDGASSLVCGDEATEED